MHDEVLEWQRKLERTFGQSGTIGGSRLIKLYQLEDAYPAHINERYYGHTVLADCFVSFFIETLELTHPHCSGGKGSQELGEIFIQQIANFKTLRAAQNAFFHGYPLGGFALLRDLKDQSLFIAAIALGITTFKAIKGFEGLTTVTPETMDLARRQRIREERRVLGLMVRQESGLPADTLADLQRWETLFHYEVHGSGLTSANTMTQWMSEAREFPVYPTPNKSADAVLINRFEEISWMLLRTFPFLQLHPGLFGREWEQKWTVLDESFFTAISRAKHELADAMVTLTSEKFPFHPSTTHFSEVQKH